MFEKLFGKVSDVVHHKIAPYAHGDAAHQPFRASGKTEARRAVVTRW